MSNDRPAVALTIAGSDPSGGAGIQADLKTFTALGVYGASVITALTAQNTRGVTGVFKVPVDFISAQFNAVASDLSVGAVKTGMLADQETVTRVAALLQPVRFGPLIVDPVMVATSGDLLLSEDAIQTLRVQLLPLADLVTPNLSEAAKLLEIDEAEAVDDMARQGRALLALGCRAVLLKGGHGESSDAIDVLVEKDRVTPFARPRIATRNTHGTGCTLAAAITAALADGLPLDAAVALGKDFVWQALKAGAGMQVGEGSGPVDHLFNLKKIPKS